MDRADAAKSCPAITEASLRHSGTPVFPPPAARTPASCCELSAQSYLGELGLCSSRQHVHQAARRNIFARLIGGLSGKDGAPEVT